MNRIITVRFRSTVHMTCALISNICNTTSTHSHAPSSSVSATARSCSITNPSSFQNATVSFSRRSCVSAVLQHRYEVLKLFTGFISAILSIYRCKLWPSISRLIFTMNCVIVTIFIVFFLFLWILLKVLPLLLITSSLGMHFDLFVIINWMLKFCVVVMVFSSNLFDIDPLFHWHCFWVYQISDDACRFWIINVHFVIGLSFYSCHFIWP